MPNSLLARTYETLFVEHRLPYRITHRGTVWNTVVAAPLRQAWLRSRLTARLATLPDDVTVVMGYRNRDAKFVRCAFDSLRKQSHPRELIRIILTDMASDPAYQAICKSLCAEYDVEYIYVNDPSEFNRAYALNIGIRAARSKYVLTSDLDIVYDREYLAAAIRELQADPLSSIHAPMLDLPESAWEHLDPLGDNIDYSDLRSLASPRTHGDCHHSICMTVTQHFYAVRGHDEQFFGWGGEDNDLCRRFYFYGLTARSLAGKAHYYHLWHPRFIGYDPKTREERYRINIQRMQANKSIRCNSNGWGIVK